VGKIQHRRTHDIADADDHEGDIYDGLINTSSPLTNANPPIPDGEKGAANGVAELDSGGKVPTGQLPVSVTGAVFYKGTWDATGNTPTLSDSGGGGQQGDYYVVGTAGSTPIDGISDWKLGDWILNNGSVWEKVDNTQDPHAFGGAMHQPDTKANVNAKVSDADFEDKTVLETTMDSKITTHKGDAAAHHSKTSSVGELSDHNKATHDALNIDADTVDGEHVSDLETTMDSKDAAAIGTHAGIPAAHHAKYTDGEAETTVKTNVEVGDLKTPTKALSMNGQKVDGLPSASGSGEAVRWDEFIALQAGIIRKKTVIDYVDCTAAPPTEVTDDRYILDFTGGTVHADWDGAAKGDIVEFGGSTWAAETPEEGWEALIDAENHDRMYIDDGVPDWEIRPVAVTAHGDLTGVTAAQHHAKYLDSEAVSAMGVKGAGNPLNHDRPVQATESVVGIAEIATQVETDAGTDDAKIVTPKKLAGCPSLIFGTQLNSGESLGESTFTGSTAWQTKLSLIMGALPAGDYFVEWACNLGSDSTGDEMDVVVEEDNGGTAGAGVERDIGQLIAFKLYTNGHYPKQSGFFRTTLTAAAHRFDIIFRTMNGGKTVAIKNGRIALWRLS